MFFINAFITIWICVCFWKQKHQSTIYLDLCTPLFQMQNKNRERKKKEKKTKFKWRRMNKSAEFPFFTLLFIHYSFLNCVHSINMIVDKAHKKNCNSSWFHIIEYSKFIFSGDRWKIEFQLSHRHHSSLMAVLIYAFNHPFTRILCNFNRSGYLMRVFGLCSIEVLSIDFFTCGIVPISEE